MQGLLKFFGQLATDALESLKNEQTRTRLALIVIRYSAMGLVGVLLAHHVITEDQKKRLLELVVDPSVISLVGSGLLILATAMKSFFTQSKETSTAAASGTPMTQQEVTVLAKQAAPPLSTPKDEVPKLAPVTTPVPNEPKE